MTGEAHAARGPRTGEPRGGKVRERSAGVSRPGTDAARIGRELYGIVPAQFVAARKARAAQLRAAGERDVATAVAALPKASASAWAVTAVVREQAAEVDALSQLGAELRVAQASGNARELRELSRRRRTLTDRVTAAAARLADDDGVALSAAALDQVAGTWHAVVIDRAAERAVRSGLLVRPLEPGAVDLTAALALPVVTDDETVDDGAPLIAARGGDRSAGDGAGAGGRATAEQSATERAEAERAELAERERAVAEDAVVAARQEVAATAEALARVQAEVLRAAAAVEEARRELSKREDVLAGLDERQGTAHEAHEAAEAHLAQAQHTLAERTAAAPQQSPSGSSRRGAR